MEVSQAVTAPATVERFELPRDVYVVEDGLGRQWTNIEGARRLAGKSRRTIHFWVKNRWVTVRRTPANRAEILVATLWRDPVEADQPVEPAAPAAPLTAEMTDGD